MKWVVDPESDEDNPESDEGAISSANGGATVPAKPKTAAKTASKATAIKYRLSSLKEISPQHQFTIGRA